MNRGRRRFLMAAAPTIGMLAGCSASGVLEEDDTNEMKDTKTESMNVSTTTALEPVISIKSSKLQTKEMKYDTETSILGTVVNTGDRISGGVSVTGRFYDKDGNLLESTTDRLHYLKPGETWLCYLPCYENGEQVESHKIEGGESHTEPPSLSVEGLTVADTRLNKESDRASLTGIIENNLEEEIDYIRAYARFWRDNVILASKVENISSVPAGENWKFKINYRYDGERWKDTNKYDVIPGLSDFNK